MIILTLKERQLIDHAVLEFGDDKERRIWREWKNQYAEVRVPDGPEENGNERLPWQIVNVAVNNLSRLEAALSARIRSDKTSDDEAADLCNDLADIHSTSELIRTAA